MIFKARNAATGEGALVRVYGKDTDLLLDRRCGAVWWGGVCPPSLVSILFIGIAFVHLKTSTPGHFGGCFVVVERCTLQCSSLLPFFVIASG